MLAPFMQNLGIAPIESLSVRIFREGILVYSIVVYGNGLTAAIV